MSGHIGCAEPNNNRSWKQQAKEAAVYEKNVWAKGFPAARKKLWYKKQLTKKEQLYFNALKKRVGGIAAIIALLGMVYGAYKVKKYYDKTQKQDEEEIIEEKESDGKEEESSSSEEEEVGPRLTIDEEEKLFRGSLEMQKEIFEDRHTLNQAMNELRNALHRSKLFGLQFNRYSTSVEDLEKRKEVHEEQNKLYGALQRIDPDDELTEASFQEAKSELKAVGEAWEKFKKELNEKYGV